MNHKEINDDIKSYCRKPPLLDKLVLELKTKLPSLSDTVWDTLKQHLSVHDIGEEDPLLLVEYLQRLQEVCLNTIIFRSNMFL